MIAYHFVDGKLRDGSPVPSNGVWLEHKGPLKMCESGLHASIDPFDALTYAPGPVLCKVEIAGEIIKDTDKLVCSRRKIIARVDLTETLHYFARMQALSVVHLWDAPDVVLDYLMTADEELRAAAWAAAWAAARAAAWAAARAAAEAAAWAAARAAARAAAEAAAEAAAGAAAGDEFNLLVTEAFSTVE